jgi:homogentisate 1,2-dioxygenase
MFARDSSEGLAPCRDRSIGERVSDLTAFMIDTFEPVRQTAHAAGIEADDYHREWLPH